MNKTEYVFLIILLAFSIVSVGGAEQSIPLEQNATEKPPVNIAPATPMPLFSARLPGIFNNASTWRNRVEPISLLPSEQAPIPFITRLLFDRIQKPCWLRLADIQRQSNGVLRYAHGTRLNIITIGRLVQQDTQSPPEIHASFSKNLISNSPPGLIQRL